MAFAARQTAARTPEYVSPSSKSLRVTVNSVDGAAPPSWVNPNPIVIDFATSGSNSNCTVSSGTETCTIAVPGPPGSVSYTFELFDGAGATGNKVGTITQTFQIAQNQTAPLDVTMSAIAASVSVSGNALAPSTAIPGIGSSERLAIAASDADRNSIDPSAPLANPIPLSISDASGATSLSTGASASCPGTASVTLTSLQQPLWLCYSGEATSTVAISSSSGGGTIAVTPSAIALSGTALCTAETGCASTDADYNAPALFFTSTGVGAARTFSASEPGWTQSPYNQQFDLTLDPGTCNAGQMPSLRPAIASASAVVSISANPATSWTVTPLAAGICKGTIGEHAAVPLSASGTVVWFSVTTGTTSGF
jgi:hypothetical protein